MCIVLQSLGVALQMLHNYKAGPGQNIESWLDDQLLYLDS